MRSCTFYKLLCFLSISCLLTLGLYSTAIAQTSLTGNWTGTWQSSYYSESGSVSFQITQSGTALSGTMTITNSGDCHGTYTYPITGSVSGSSVSFSGSGTVCSSSGSASFNASVSGNTMSGTYTTYENGSATDTGTIVLNKSITLTGNWTGTFASLWDGLTASTIYEIT